MYTDMTPVMTHQYDRDAVEMGTRVANEYQYLLMFGDGQTQARINQADVNCTRYLD
jgi:hypothetical protein